PTAVPAIEWLAWNHAVEAALRYVEPAAGFEQARQLAQRALQLDPKSSIAYQCLAYVHYVYDWDWAAAERDAKEAVRLNPNDSGAIGELGDVYRALGRWDESARLYETAISVDPLSAPWHSHLRALLLSTGRLREAEAEARKVLQIAPTYTGGSLLPWLGTPGTRKSGSRSGGDATGIQFLARCRFSHGLLGAETPRGIRRRTRSSRSR